MTEDAAAGAAAELVRDLNRAWQAQDWARLQELALPQVCMTGPGLQPLARGADAFVRGFRDFMAHARIHRFLENDMQVTAAAGTAVVNYAFEIEYSDHGEQRRDTGRDCFVLALTPEGWRVVWRTMFFAPQ